MEMGESSFSEFYRNTSEEIFLKTLMEGSLGTPVPTMETLGLKNLTLNCRTDSEEIFKNWLTMGENGDIPLHHQQASRRISRELASLTGHHHLSNTLQRKRSNENLNPQPLPGAEEPAYDPSDPNQNSTRNMAEREIQASNLFLAKEWFQSSKPMTRSRSSELRRRYVAMQNSQTPLGMQNLSNFSGHHGNNIKQEIANQNGFGDISMSYIPNQFNSFVSPSNSSSSPFSAPPPVDNVDKVSSIVSMLKDTLERKKTNNQAELGPYSAQEVLGDSGLNQGQGSHVHATFGRFQDVSSMQVNNPSFMQTCQGSYNMDMDHFVTPMSLRTLSREPSQSESSAVATVGFDVYDGPTNPGQTMSENSRRQAENGSKDIRDRTGAKVKEEKKRGNLVRYGSVTSAGSGEKGDPTKKRRVERSRKMAEAKERNLTPTIPSNMQSILKRCENLEKEVRSLKLNLAFMNRKDSEQTKQIEELQNHNDELTNEKERLLEEIERILGDTD